MKVLGIACDVWISSAALIEDGRVVAAAPEERFDRQKMSKGFPARAVDFCLKQAGCSLGDIDQVAFAWNPGHQIRSVSGRYTQVQRWRGEYMYMVPASLLKNFGSPDVTELEQVITTTDWQARIAYIDHHASHAASTFYPSPFERAAVFTVDGRGEEDTCTWNIGDRDGIRTLQSVAMPHSMGLFYAAITEYLGFKPHTDEWKVMALASYGRPNSEYYGKLRSLLELQDDGRFEQDLTYFAYYLFDMQPHMYTPKLEALLGPARRKDEPFDGRFADIARALQEVFEETCTHMLGHLHRLTGETRLCLAGGAAMNSVYNGKITELTPFKEVFIPSCPDDSGVSVGAALAAYHRAVKGGHREVQTHNYWGPSFSDDHIGQVIERFKIKAERHDDICKATAGLLAEGKLCGWFQGAMEFGQRALGHRSIIADPRDETVKDRVNAAVKFREGFRPFAPAVLAEVAEDYFDMPAGMTVPFMERVFPVREDKRVAMPAVVHADGTGRLQTVTRAASPRFYDLIKEFGALTGLPIILNTSFNLNGEPVVCTPEDAIRTFFTCGLDVLVLGSWVIRK